MVVKVGYYNCYDIRLEESRQLEFSPDLFLNTADCCFFSLGSSDSPVRQY